MKKIIILITILIILSTIHCVALDSSIWYKFPVPEYSYSHAYLSPARILDWKIQGEKSAVYVGGNVLYEFFCQKEKSTVYYNGVISGEWERNKSEVPGRSYIQDMKRIMNTNKLGATRYLGILNVWSDCRLDILARNNQKCKTDLGLEVGVGLGRIVQCSSVNQTIQLLQEFNISLDENLILKVATLIDKISVYKTQYRHTWQEVFYQEVAEMIGKPDQGLKVRRVLTSNIYSSYYRSRGWEVKIGYRNSFFCFKDQPKGYITLLAEYVVPWGLNKQINLRTRCNRNLDDDSYLIDVDAYLLFQHSLTWASQISLFADKEFHTKLEQGNAYYGVRLGSKKNIFDKLVSGLSLNLYKSRNSSDPYFDLSIDLKYYLW